MTRKELTAIMGMVWDLNPQQVAGTDEKFNDGYRAALAQVILMLSTLTDGDIHDYHIFRSLQEAQWTIEKD